MARKLTKTEKEISGVNKKAGYLTVTEMRKLAGLKLNLSMMLGRIAESAKYNTEVRSEAKKAYAAFRVFEKSHSIDRMGGFGKIG